MVTIDNETQKIISKKEKMEEENFGKNPEFSFKVFDIERKHSKEKIGNSKNLLHRLEEMRNNSRDINVMNKDLRVSLNEDNILILKTRQGESLQFTRSGFTQFCGKYEVPSNYMKKCIIKDKAQLALKNLNLWIKNSNPEKENLIRIYNDRVRGFLSEKYSIMDNSEAVNDLQYSIVNSETPYTIERTALNEEKMNLRLVREEQININGEILHVGFRMKNSEVGLHRLELELLLYKQICTNGMIFGGGSGYFFSRKHLGDNNDFRGDFNSLITTIPKAIDYVKNSVEIGINKQLNSERIQSIIDKFCYNFKIEKDGEEEREKVYSLVNNYGRNMWGISNAITEYAQNFSVEDQEEAEKYSAKLIFR